MQKRATASDIQATVSTLIAYPKTPNEKMEFRTASRPRTTEMRMGSPYEVDRQIVATPVNELNAADDPK